MSRLILVAGTDTAVTSLLARRTAAQIGAEGLTCVLVDGTRAPLDADFGAVTTLTRALGSALVEVGADPVSDTEWAGLPTLSALTVLTTAVDALAEADAVVVDAGALAQVRVLAETPSAVARLLDSALTPRLAMHRTSAGESVLFDAFSAARLDAQRLVRALRSAETTARLVTAADEGAAERTAETLAALTLLGVTVDGIAVTGVPRRSDDVPKQVRRTADAVVARLALDGSAVWSTGRRVRPAPKGRTPVAVLPAARGLDDADLVVSAGEEDLTLDVPLAAAARADVRVGVQGDRLVVESARTRRWLELPSVLRRCVPVQAHRTTTGLRVVFTPDPATWRQAEEAS